MVLSCIRLWILPGSTFFVGRNLPTIVRHLSIQFSELSFPPLGGSAPSSAVTGSARLIQTSAGSLAALGGPPTKRSRRAA